MTLPDLPADAGRPVLRAGAAGRRRRARRDGREGLVRGDEQRRQPERAAPPRARRAAHEGRRPPRVLLAAHEVPRRRRTPPRSRRRSAPRSTAQAERASFSTWAGSTPVASTSSSSAAGRRVGERPEVGEHVGAGLQAEVELVEVAHHRHVEAAAVHDRADRVVGDHAGADRVERERRAGHVGDGDVEQRSVAVGHLRAACRGAPPGRRRPGPRTRPSRRACRRRSPSAAPSPRPCTRGSPRGAPPGRRRRWRGS